MKRCRAFTMIELLLALMITSLLTASLSMLIGQAARDRVAMQEQTEDPVWALSLIDLIERDLQQATSWAGADDRLVLIGLGHDGMPAQIEYRWGQADVLTTWSRQEIGLTTNSARKDEAKGLAVAINLAGIAVGANTYGQSIPNLGDTRNEISQPSASLGQPPNSSIGNTSIIVDGQRFSLQPLPDRVAIRVMLPGDEPTIVQREVVLR